MYSKKNHSLFHRVTTFYKNGQVYAWHEEDGSWAFIHPGKAPVCLTRSQGFRYWEKHFPGRACYTLPPLLEAAVAIAPEAEAYTCVYEQGGLIHTAERG